ncbi:MAG: hypothetical protein ABFC31_12675 [Clostridiaceae bacterium]
MESQSLLKRWSWKAFFVSNPSNAPIRFSWFVNLLFALSGAAATMLFTQRGSIGIGLAGAVCSFAVCALFAFRFHALERAFCRVSPAKLLVSAGFALYTAHVYSGWYRASMSDRMLEKINGVLHLSQALTGMLHTWLSTAFAVASLIALFTLFYVAIDRFLLEAGRRFRTADKVERRYLLVAGLLAAVLIVCVYSLTSAFTVSGIPYDVVYTADSGTLLETNTFLNINAWQNDIRQPLFGVFSLPFSVTAELLSKALFFVPNAYPILLGIIQALLLLFCCTAVARMLRLQGIKKALFLALMTVSYPVLLFLLCVEQYIFALFWVILLVETYCENAPRRRLAFVAATGSLLTSGALVFLLPYEKSFRSVLRELLRAAGLLLAFLAFFGQFPLLYSAAASIRDLMSFSGTGLGFGDKLLQYINFVAACVVRPFAGVDTTTYLYPSYQLYPVTAVNPIGVAVLVLAAVGFALNRKSRLARVSLGWAAFSFVLLCLIGWGTAENGLVLYTLYFSWAYLVLAYLALDAALKKWKTVQSVVSIAAVTALLAVNAANIINIILFGIRYYPVK